MQISGVSPHLICEETVSAAGGKAHSEHYFQLLDNTKVAGKW